MSYAIVDIVYGIPLTEELRKANDKFYEGYATEDLPEEAFILEGEDEGGLFKYEYSASLNMPAYLGVSIDSFDECSNSPMPDFYSMLTKEDKKKAEDKFNQLPEHLKEVALPIGFYMIWSSS